MTAPQSKEALTGELRDLERRSFGTYRARMVATGRLESRHNAWPSSLLAVTTGAVIASVALLVAPTIYGTAGGLLLAALSVLTLVVSLATTGLNYSARSRNMFRNYRKSQRISVEAENMLRLPEASLDVDKVADLQSRYQALLDESENHTQADYELAHLAGVPVSPLTVGLSRAATLLPYGLLAFPIALMVPVIIACIEGF